MASRGVNKVILVGNLGQDPEVRYMPNGNAVANLTLATSETWKDKQTGEQKEQTEWHRVTMYRRLAEIVGEYLKKGSKIYVEGRLQTRKWQDQQGQDRYTTEIVANEMQMLDSRSPGGNQPQYQPSQQGGSQPQQGASGFQQGGQQPVAAPQQPQGGFQQGGKQQANQPPAAPQQASNFNEPSLDFDDDIPF